MGSSYGHIQDNKQDQTLQKEKVRMQDQERSEGDGMETSSLLESNSRKPMDFSKDIKTLPTTFVPVTTKRKEPKFVPYEPYKAAVSPILSTGKKQSPSNKLVIETSLIKPLASQVIRESSLALSSANGSTVLHKDVVTHVENCVPEQTQDEEKVLLENKISELQKDKKELETQFNIQIQVNTDLKKLLVASLGEDMQAKVQYMTEDKAKLGEHVLLYSQKLSQNNEELEKVSVESGMWKSKFEASSVLIDELASWKAVLSTKFNEAAEIIEGLLKEHHESHQLLSHAFNTLHSIQEAFDPSARRDSPCSQSPWNLLQVVGAISSMSEDIQNRLLGSLALDHPLTKLDQFRSLTPNEQLAHKLLDSVDTLPALTKLEVSQKQHLRLGSKACSLLPHNCTNETIVNCCNHCSGKIRLI